VIYLKRAVLSAFFVLTENQCCVQYPLQICGFVNLCVVIGNWGNLCLVYDFAETGPNFQQEVSSLVVY